MTCLAVDGVLLRAACTTWSRSTNPLCTQCGLADAGCALGGVTTTATAASTPWLWDGRPPEGEGGRFLYGGQGDGHTRYPGPSRAGHLGTRAAKLRGSSAGAAIAAAVARAGQPAPLHRQMVVGNILQQLPGPECRCVHGCPATSRWQAPDHACVATPALAEVRLRLFLRHVAPRLLLLLLLCPLRCVGCRGRVCRTVPVPHAACCACCCSCRWRISISTSGWVLSPVLLSSNRCAHALAAFQ